MGLTCGVEWNSPTFRVGDLPGVVAVRPLPVLRVSVVLYLSGFARAAGRGGGCGEGFPLFIVGTFILGMSRLVQKRAVVTLEALCRVGRVLVVPLVIYSLYTKQRC